MTSSIGTEIRVQAAEAVRGLPERVRVVRAVHPLQAGDELVLQRSSFPGWVCSRVGVVCLGHMIRWFLERGVFEAVNAPALRS